MSEEYEKYLITIPNTDKMICLDTRDKLIDVELSETDVGVNAIDINNNHLFIDTEYQCGLGLVELIKHIEKLEYEKSVWIMKYMELKNAMKPILKEYYELKQKGAKK